MKIVKLTRQHFDRECLGGDVVARSQTSGEKFDDSFHETSMCWVGVMRLETLEVMVQLLEWIDNFR